MDWREELAKRPWWANLILGFCLFMTFVYVPWDLLLKPLARDQDVWFGIMFTGWSAKAGALLHWMVYAGGAYGLWRMRPWIWPAAALYIAQISFSMLVWGVSYGPGVLAGIVSAVPFALLAGFLWRRPRTQAPANV